MIGRPRNTAAVVRKCLVCAGGKTTCQDVLLASKICDALQSESIAIGRGANVQTRERYKFQRWRR